MNFEEIWGRIKSRTDIKTFSELAKLLETTGPYISRKRKENDFPVIWAFVIAQKYDLSTDWIMTGKGPKRIQEKGRSAFLIELEEWAKEISESENLKWLENQIENQFSDFKRWREEKKKPSEITTDCPSSKVA